MDRKKFFDALRKSSLFPVGLSPQQVQGIEAILDSCTRNKVRDGHHVANVLAQVYHETGRYMLGIKETVMPSHINKNPADATVRARLASAYAAGKMPWVKTPYWDDGFFGRGPIQLTHRSNYEKMGRRLGVGLVGSPDLALDPKVGADIAVVGMLEGMFTGKKLSQYAFPGALDAPAASNPRRIVNGQDGTDAKIAGYHRAFYAAIVQAGGWSLGKAPVKETVGTVAVGTGTAVAAKEAGWGWAEAFGIAFAVGVAILVVFIIWNRRRA